VASLHSSGAIASNAEGRTHRSLIARSMLFRST
jgi:hypothetical protein